LSCAWLSSTQVLSRCDNAVPAPRSAGTSRVCEPALAGGRAEAEGERLDVCGHRPSFRSETSRPADATRAGPATESDHTSNPNIRSSAPAHQRSRSSSASRSPTTWSTRAACISPETAAARSPAGIISAHTRTTWSPARSDLRRRQPRTGRRRLPLGLRADLGFPRRVRHDSGRQGQRPPDQGAAKLHRSPASRPPAHHLPAPRTRHLAIANATDCLRDRDARGTAEPKVVIKMSAERNWTIRRFRIGRNGLNLLWTPSDDSAPDVHARAAAAGTAVDPSRLRPHRIRQIVYWWDEPPSRPERATLNRCVRGTPGLARSPSAKSPAKEVISSPTSAVSPATMSHACGSSSAPAPAKTFPYATTPGSPRPRVRLPDPCRRL
jgi:hypothetical protein